MNETISVLIVDDDALVRAGLAMILGGVDDIRVVGEVADGAHVVEAVERHRPDVVLMDIRMPEMDGVQAAELLHAQQDGPEVIILTTFDADDNVLRALRAGASGFLLKDTPPTDIIKGIRLAAAGDPILAPQVMRRLIARVTRDPADRGDNEAAHLLRQLGQREREVALLIGKGKSNAEIGDELYMSMASVKAHVSRLLTKLNLHNRVQIALMTCKAHLPERE
ncbi:response regulator [Amycolatopsis sp. CA-230715]|uniref:response regulator n=1 Tax=Amycolatopsis sp. CA-230715 TaxID=2745196 RepID=UPI001C341643|nr:response regulator transcription factor [Amycolatopsis sp. CA-230715]QWF78530.1 Transcriptional regulatory protein LiaR [Amycolatopsis sp. CA-230715]